MPRQLPPAGSSERFAREARTGMRIRNEHVARVYDVGVVDGALEVRRRWAHTRRAPQP
jgi:hypothetical protein